MRPAPTARALAVLACAAVLAGCIVKDPPPITEAWTDEFSREQTGRNYKPTSEQYVIDDGVLSVKGAFNHPLWLRKKLPDDVVIELDAWSDSADGDLKVEIFGDGESYAEGRGAYTATGYVLGLGGWNNTKSFIARLNEHGDDLVSRNQPRVVVGKKYHWKIVRNGGRVDWYVDDMETPFLTFDDAQPLRGGDHAYFGFNNWQSDAHFDNLRIAPL